MTDKSKAEAALEEPPDATLSTLHENSTYAPYEGDVDQNPPPGPTVIQTLGKPADTPAAEQRAGKSGA